jgi:hypothetical protein
VKKEQKVSRERERWILWGECENSFARLNNTWYSTADSGYVRSVLRIKYLDEKDTFLGSNES